MAKNPNSNIAERIVVPVSEEMREAIHSYWHDNRLPSKSEAVRQLVAFALENIHKARPAAARSK